MITSDLEFAQLLTLLQHGDSQFPTGAFAFSSGLEGLLADGLTNAVDLGDLISDLLHWRWAPFDRVLLHRAWQADGALPALAALETELEAALLAPAERAGSLRTGAALLTTHAHLGTRSAAALRAAIDVGKLCGHRIVMEGALWRDLGLDEQQAALLSAYAFVNMLGTAAVRLGVQGALGQQRLLAALLPAMAALAAAPLAPTVAPSAFNPLAEIAIMRQPARDRCLFST
ncbi:MAG: urease accessory UreF family protein [Gammaproteobacteria bacterium]